VVSPARKGWDKCGTMIPSAIGAAPFCCVVTDTIRARAPRSGNHSQKTSLPFAF
jgi:hypothetical protein